MWGGRGNSAPLPASDGGDGGAVGGPGERGKEAAADIEVSCISVSRICCWVGEKWWFW